MGDDINVNVGGGVKGNVNVAGRDSYIYNHVERAKAEVPYLAPGLPAHHVARLGELKQLVERIKPGANGLAITTLHGMGGVGKTTLAIALCHDKNILDAFADGVLWATLGPQGDVLSAQQAWAEALADISLSEVGSMEARTARLRGMLHGKQCLLVIDDVWDGEHLEHLMVGGKQCFTLVTAREFHVAQSAGEEFALGMLEPGEAVALLESWTGERETGTREEAEELAARLGHLPLALRLAGAQAMDGVTWAGLLEELREAQGDLSVLDMDEPTRKKSLKLAFDLSVGRLNKNLQARFAMLGVFAAGRDAPFDVKAAAAVWETTPAGATKSLGRLARAALLEKEDKQYILHLLLGDYARGNLDNETRVAAEERHGAYYLEVAEQSEEKWQVAEAALPQMRAAWGRVAKDDGDTLFKWATAAHRFFNKRGYWDDNIKWTEAALAAAQAAGERVRESWCENTLGYVYDSLGRLEEALAHYEASLTIDRELGNRDGKAASLNNIGGIYDTRGELEEALAHYEASLTILREVGDRVNEAGSLNNIGYIYQQRGELEEALMRFETSLTIDRELGNRAGEATSLNNIGSIYRQRGELDEALVFHEASLKIRREVGDRAGETGSLNNIGGIYQQRGEPDEALARYEESLTIQREVGDRAGEARSLNNIGLVYDTRGELDEALAHYEASLMIRREVGERAGEATSLNNIGLVHYQRGNFVEAIRLLEQVVAIEEQIGLPDLADDRAALEQVRAELKAQGGG